MSTTLKIAQHDIRIRMNDTHNIQKGLVSIQGYDILDYDNIKED